ncbi:MAG: oxidoreductase [Bacteroidetes bacterium]|nr:oxidoreductase [Bacteroidota bacterium]
MAAPWRTGKFIKIEQATANTRRYWIQIPELENFSFNPGQFVTLDLPIHEKVNKRWRSYSIASHPDGTNIIELVIVLLEGGAGTTYLFNQINEGDEVLLRGPQGVFVLPPIIEKDLFFICTGTGIAPFRSMLHYIREHRLPHRKLYLISGCRYIADGLYTDEMKMLEAEIPHFSYIPTYSREPKDRGVCTGYVHDVYEKIVQSENRESKFYLCGWKDMIDDARKNIVALGYDKKDIHFELYG